MSGAVAVSLAVAVVAVSDTLLYFIPTAQNHTQRLKLDPLKMQDQKIEDQITSKANVNYWKIQAATLV